MTSCDANPSDSREVFGVFEMFEARQPFEPIRSPEIRSVSLIAGRGCGFARLIWI
jgi:hypothetical protein